jgi:hypothetical protein
MSKPKSAGFAVPGGESEQAAVSFTPPGASEQAAMTFTPPVSQESQSPIMAIIERNRARLAGIEGVHGISEGRSRIGDPVVRIDVDNESVRQRLPKEIDGYPVEVILVPGGFDVLPA